MSSKLIETEAALGELTVLARGNAVQPPLAKRMIYAASDALGKALGLRTESGESMRLDGGLKRE
jgi:hypothetical protein